MTPKRAPTATRQRVHWLAAAAAALLLQLLVAVPLLAQEAAPQDLTGVYTVTIGEPDLPNGLPGRASLLGLWTVAFNADGTYTLDRQDVGRVAAGTYEVAGSTLTLNDWTGIVGCGTPTETTAAADYAWRVDDRGLTLTPINEACPDRRILLATRPFASFEACATTPLAAVPLSDPDLAAPAATPVASLGVGAQEGRAPVADPEEAIDRLLRQGTGCWATGDPTRFLPLHSREVLAELGLLGPLPEFAATLQTIMTTPLSFQRIGNVTMVDPTRAWAYVEVTFGGEPLPQRMDFVFEDGTWLMDTFFLFGPAPDAPPEP
jgi:hypothetical protein